MEKKDIIGVGHRIPVQCPKCDKIYDPVLYIDLKKIHPFVCEDCHTAFVIKPKRPGLFETAYLDPRPA